MAVKNFVNLFGTQYDLADGANLAASVEASSTAAHAHAIGEHFLYNGLVYVATQAIAVGDSISVGTNCDRIYVADKLLKLDDSLTVAGAAADAKKTGNEFSGLESEIDTLEEKKANIDGYYEDMTVGNAEQLFSTQLDNDKVPYTYRTTGGSKDVGNRAYVDKIIGGTICWNQLYKKDDGSYEVDGITFTVDNGVVTANGTATAQVIFNANTVNVPEGHKILIMGCPSGGSTIGYRLQDGWSGSSNDVRNGAIYAVSSNAKVVGQIVIANGTTVTNVVFRPQIYDLTMMFGSAVADAVYTMTQSGAAKTWFEKIFPNKLYKYDAGTVRSVSGLSSKVTVGFNQWDEEWEIGRYNTSTGAKEDLNSTIRSKNYIPVLPNTEYYDKAPETHWILQYDINHTFISAGVRDSNNLFVTNDATRYITFYMNTTYGTTYNHDICINLSWSGYRNGEYEPYDSHAYALDNSLTLRGIPRINASNGLYYDGDVYANDGTVIRKFGTYTFTGSEEWTKVNDDAYSANLISTVKRPADANTVATWVMIPGLEVVTRNQIAFGAQTGNVFAIGADGQVYISATVYANASTILTGNAIVFELAEYTSEIADAYQRIQIVDDFGTEQYVGTSLVPIGHDTSYPANLRDKLQHLPNNADADGRYVIQQTNKQMSLVLSGEELPDMPTEDGTYHLRCIVSDGEPTLSWVSDT